MTGGFRPALAPAAGWSSAYVCRPRSLPLSSLRLSSQGADERLRLKTLPILNDGTCQRKYQATYDNWVASRHLVIPLTTLLGR